MLRFLVSRIRDRVQASVNVAAALCCSLVMAGTAHADSTGSTGAVFAATNGLERNEIVMYKRLPTGRLSFVGKFPTGGRGEGGINDPLQSESSLLLTPDHHYLLAVNAGSSTISVFAVFDVGIVLLSVTPSGGGNPVSLAIHDNLVYVVNFGGIYHTAGFRLQPWGELVPVKNSQVPLSGLDTEPSTIAFTPDGSKLVLSERQTNKIDVFTVKDDGSLANPVFNNSLSVEPFGLQFTPNGTLLVTAAQSGAMSSYAVNADNTISIISALSPSSGGATCWVAANGTNAWVSNSVSSSISAYSLTAGGALTPLGPVAVQPATSATIFPPVVPPTSFPIDLALSADQRYLYVVYSTLGQIVGYTIGNNGKLTVAEVVSPYEPRSGVEGLAVY